MFWDYSGLDLYTLCFILSVCPFDFMGIYVVCEDLLYVWYADMLFWFYIWVMVLFYRVDLLIYGVYFEVGDAGMLWVCFAIVDGVCTCFLGVVLVVVLWVCCHVFVGGWAWV